MKSTEPVSPPATVKPGRVLFVLIVLIALGLAGGLLPRWKQRDTLRAETAELATPTVNVVTPAPGAAAGGLWLPGEIKPLVEAPIYARANGYLKRRFVDIGAPVKEGALLA